MRLFDSERPKWLNISTSCELLVKCLTLSRSTTCLGVFTRPFVTKCRRSSAIHMTCLCFWSDSVGRHLNMHTAPMSADCTHSTHASRLYIHTAPKLADCTPDQGCPRCYVVLGEGPQVLVVVLSFTSLLGTNGLLNDIVMR